MSNIHRIVLTGGPCGGKSTALSMIDERLSSLGYRVFMVPEIPTLLVMGGAKFVNLSLEQIVELENVFLDVQQKMEQAFVDIARNEGSPAVILCDRGAMDVAAYVPPDMWTALLDERGDTVVALRDRNYDAVIHLRTAAAYANGAFYTKANNPARRETAEEAIAADLRTLEAWIGHSHLRVIENEELFEDKVRNAVAAICNVLGEPIPVERERKFLVSEVGEIPSRSVTVEIVQTYLCSDSGVESRVRRRGSGGSYVYTHTIKEGVGISRTERERRISGREYVALIGTADPSRTPIRKKRTCFVWEGQYFELDRFEAPHAGLCLLEAELETDTQKLSLPPFLSIQEEVTENREFSNFELSRI